MSFHWNSKSFRFLLRICCDVRSFLFVLMLCNELDQSCVCCFPDCLFVCLFFKLARL